MECGKHNSSAEILFKLILIIFISRVSELCFTSCSSSSSLAILYPNTPRAPHELGLAAVHITTTCWILYLGIIFRSSSAVQIDCPNRQTRNECNSEWERKCKNLYKHNQRLSWEKPKGTRERMQTFDIPTLRRIEIKWLQSILTTANIYVQLSRAQWTSLVSSVVDLVFKSSPVVLL